MERFSLQKRNEVEGEERYHVQMSNRFAALGDFDADLDTNSAWETSRGIRVREYIVEGTRTIVQCM
jgi:hypothetical protein